MYPHCGSIQTKLWHISAPLVAPTEGDYYFDFYHRLILPVFCALCQWNVLSQVWLLSLNLLYIICLYVVVIIIIFVPFPPGPGTWRVSLGRGNLTHSARFKC